MPSPKQSVATLVVYFKTFLTIGYYLLIIPYNIIPQKQKEIKDVVFSEESRKSIGFRFHSNIFQKIFCTLGYIAVLYHQLFILTHPQFSGLFPHDPKEGILAFIGIVYRFIGLTYLFCAITVFWRKKEQFMLIYKTVQSLPYSTPSNSRSTLAVMYFGFALSFCWYLLGLGGDFFDDFNSKLELNMATNFTSALNSLYTKSQWILAFNKSPGTISFETITFLQAIFALIYFLLYLFTGLLQIGVELLVVVGIVYIWHTTLLFEQWYKKLDDKTDSKSEITAQALQQYHNLKTLVSATNEILGPPMVLVIGFVLPFYATFAGFAMSTTGLPSHPTYILVAHYAIYFTEIMVAAEVNRKGNEFIRWVSSPRYLDSLSNRQLTSLSMDINSDQLALKGCGFFSLTYRFLTSMIGVFITYSVLIVQFRGRDDY